MPQAKTKRVRTNSVLHSAVHFVKPLDTLAVTVGLLTPDKNETPLWFKLYASLIIMLLGLSCVWSAYVKFHAAHCGLSKTTVNIDFFLGIFLTVVNIYAIIQAVMKRKNMVNLLKCLYEIDSFVDTKCSRRKRKRNYSLVEIFAVLLTISGYATYDISIQISTAVIYIPRLVMIVNDYFIALTVLVFYSLMISLKERFSNLNSHLVTIVRQSKNCKEANVKILRDVLDMSKIYHKLYCLIDLINKHYGFQLLGIVTLTFVYVMQLVNMILSYYNEKCVSYNIPVKHLIEQYCIISVLYMSFGIMIASSCELVIKSATDTAYICHKLLLAYPLAVNKNSQGHFLQEELLLLAHQVTHRKPKFTAADFFAVDCSMLYGMLGSIVSYIVIIIQLK